MTQVSLGWGGDPSARYEELAARFRPIFQRIREGAVERESARELPLQQVQWLKQAGFGALRLPVDSGGSGATLPELFNLLTELAAVDSNIVQGLRGHFGFVEDLVNTSSAARRALWWPRIARGDTAGNAWTEVGDGKVSGFSTKVTGVGAAARLNGAKYYTTGSFYADWIDVGASDEQGNSVVATVSRHAPGVLVVDDWDGFGQTQTASGSATFSNVVVEDGHLVTDETRPKYFPAFFQTVHLATLAGIGRAVSTDLAALVAQRRRTYSHANATRAAADPQVLQVVGRVRGAAYASGAIVRLAAEAIQRAFEARLAGDAEAEERAVATAELEVSQSLTVVSDLILGATTLLFDALGASAISRSHALDRHWRNARTLASHNPRIFKDRIVGDFAVNGTPPPPQWRIGLPEPPAPADGAAAEAVT
jgi:alkylation response protein AidB-like acyl-CoA dehydrogenase